MTLLAQSTLDPTVVTIEPPTTQYPPEFDSFINDLNSDYGWAVAGLPLEAPSPPDQQFRDKQFTWVAGSWMFYREAWVFSMAWPEALGVANYLTMSSFGDVAEMTGASADRFYPITILARTARAP